MLVCSSMLCHFGQTCNGSVAIHFILSGSNATSSATRDYEAVPKRFGQNEEPAGSNEKRTRKKSSPKLFLTDAVILQTCNHDFCIILCNLFCLILMKFLPSSVLGILSSPCLLQCCCCSRYQACPWNIWAISMHT